MEIPAAKVHISDLDIKEILKVYEQILKTGQLAWGRYNDQFEADFAKYIGVDYGVTANSGASALELILRAYNIKDKEVIVPTNTNFATASAVILSGGKPVFCDTDKNTLAPRIDQIEQQLTAKTEGLIVVHIGGIITPEIEAIAAFCKDKKIFLMEDASHAHSSEYSGKKAGTFSDFSAFSMFASKVITCGEGGIITTNSQEIKELTLSLRNQGKKRGNNDWHYLLGSTYRITEFQAILGIYQLKRIIELRSKREEIAKFYDNELKSFPYIRPYIVPEKVTSSYYKYMAWIDNNVDLDRLWKVLKEEYKISLSALVYKVPCHKQPVFKDFIDKDSKYPEAEYFCSNHICLPISSAMTMDEAAYVVESIKEAFKEKKVLK